MLPIPTRFKLDANLIKGIKNYYMYIMEHIRVTNVSTNETFRKKYCHYYTLNQTTPSSFKNIYFAYMEEHKNDRPLPSYRKVLEDLYKLTHRVHFSFASKLLHTLDDRMPILDKQIMRLLGFEIKSSEIDYKKRIDYYCDVYETVLYEYKIVSSKLKSNSQASICVALREFDKKFPDLIKLSTVRKIDMLLFNMKDGRGNSLLNI